MYGYIYLTTNLINNKKYIGQHKYSKPEIDKNYLGSGKYICRAIHTYGISNFKCEILECCDTKEELALKEKYYISKFNAVNNINFYNIDDGSGNSHEYVCKETTSKKLSEIQKQHKTINNGKEQLIINKDSLETYLKNGWLLGRLPKDYSERIKKFKNTHYSKDLTSWKTNISNSIKGRVWINNNINEKQIIKNELQMYLNNGWKRGRLFAKGKLKSLTTIENIISMKDTNK